MRHLWDEQPICQHFENPEYPETRCARLAQYVILKPPQAFKPTPTRVYTDGENPRAPSVQRRAYPTHCKEHAYVFCGLSGGGGEPIPPPPGSTARASTTTA
jgi:hypothetical protein